MGYGTARGGHLSCKQEIRWVQFPYIPRTEVMRQRGKLCLRKWHHMAVRYGLGCKWNSLTLFRDHGSLA